MNKVVRVVLLGISFYMYYLLIVSTEDVISATGVIVFVAIMLVAMELVRRRGNRIFELNSRQEVIKEMSPEKFVAYIGDLYRRKGYKIDMTSTREKKGYDILAIKGMSVIQISCIAVEDREVIEKDFDNIRFSNKINKMNVKRVNLVITNGVYSEEAKEIANEKGFNLIDYKELVKIIQTIAQDKEKMSRLRKIQRA